MLAIAGALCLMLCGVTAYKTYPREGKPPSFWQKTENRTVMVVMFMLILLFAGVTMLLKSIF
jgi:hypothetical protein